LVYSTVRNLGSAASDFGNLALTRTPTKKNTFSNITRVPVIRIRHMRARLKDLSVEIFLCLRLIAICAYGLPPNPAKVPNFQDNTCWVSIINSMVIMENVTNLIFEPTAMIRLESRNYKIHFIDQKYQTDDKKSYSTSNM
jgi:hypothetical protein